MKPYILTGIRAVFVYSVIFFFNFLFVRNSSGEFLVFILPKSVYILLLIFGIVGSLWFFVLGVIIYFVLGVIFYFLSDFFIKLFPKRVKSFGTDLNSNLE